MVAAPLLDSSSGWAWTVSSRSEVSGMGRVAVLPGRWASAIVAEPTDNQRVDRWQRCAGPERSLSQESRGPTVGATVGARRDGPAGSPRLFGLLAHRRDQQRYAVGELHRPLDRSSKDGD